MLIAAAERADRRIVRSGLEARALERLAGIDYAVMPDRIEAGTFLAAAAATRGSITLTDAPVSSLDPVIQKLREAGAGIAVGESTVRIADPRGNPEDAAIFRQRNELIQKVLQELGIRDREILTRFYLREQSQEQICVEMGLSETQFRLLKSRAKARFGELGKKKLAGRALQSVSMRTSAGMSH